MTLLPNLRARTMAWLRFEGHGRSGHGPFADVISRGNCIVIPTS